ncbi:hypothetical protein Phi40:1_gp068 [Cellulophaga phage phi40:1]|uniref:Uncharacterized protein n=1 Tax=Cellulophaga phage phi38:1 TaxID=1327977 RepID=S0A1M1_9CAUD|nr:hypothetical protein Phi38:1_gp068 [Cellulophaga phage phi38:1]AGO47933.1 hypothetical protein Phi40:1_gp068 [Cellulophaga phage phi40:1]AGO48098.1 hypothetical protein Phi38:1_gp068 [Cellulophaga phage phi38:1]
MAAPLHYRMLCCFIARPQGIEPCPCTVLETDCIPYAETY